MFSSKCAFSGDNAAVLHPLFMLSGKNVSHTRTVLGELKYETTCKFVSKKVEVPDNEQNYLGSVAIL